MTHIERLYDFAFAYTTPKNRYYKDKLLFDKIQKGLEYWHERNPWCHNWWYNQIAEPQCLGILLIQMQNRRTTPSCSIRKQTFKKESKKMAATLPNGPEPTGLI